MQSVVTGRAFNRSMPISSPHSSQTPYSPSCNRCKASCIFREDELTLPVAHAQHGVSVRFHARPVRWVRKIRILIHNLDRLTGFRAQLINFLAKKIREKILCPSVSREPFVPHVEVN